MFTATFFCLGLAVCITAGLVCYSVSKFAKGWAGTPSAKEKAVWEEIKTAVRDLYSKYECNESKTQKSLRSWAGTLVICAGLCMIGVILEVEYGRSISADHIFSGIVGGDSAPTAAYMPMHAAHPSAAKPAK